MIDQLKEILVEWNKKHSSFAKLQHSYLGVALIIVLVAGIVGLINYNLGQSMLFLSLILFLMFIANGIAHALLESLVFTHLTKRSSARTKKK